MSRVRGLFVTGTDTGVGKTVVTAALTAALRADGLDVGVWKPVQSGALIGNGATDAERLVQMAGIDERPESVSPFTFAAPLTPLLAAKQAGVTLTLKELVIAGERLLNRYEALLIEGAGGVAVPLTEDALVADFIAELGIPALIVARSGLGTINHTLLTISYLRQCAVPIAGVILNDGDRAASHNDPSSDTNAELIERYSGLKVLGRFPCLQSAADTATLIHIVRQTLQLTQIKQALAIQTHGGE